MQKTDIIIFYTGWQNKIEAFYMSHNHGLSIDAANYLVRKKDNDVAIVGPSITPGIELDSSS